MAKTPPAAALAARSNGRRRHGRSSAIPSPASATTTAVARCARPGRLITACTTTTTNARPAGSTSAPGRRTPDSRSRTSALPSATSASSAGNSTHDAMRLMRRALRAACGGLLDDHGERRLLALVAELADPVDHVEARADLADDGVVRRQPDVLAGHDEELARRRARRLVARLGHRHHAVRVLGARRRLVDRRVAGAARSGAGRVAALDDEPRDDAVEDRAVIEAALGQRVDRRRGL